MSRRDLLERYRDGWRAVTDALDGVDLDARPGRGEWTPREIVHHLLDSELTRASRLRVLLTQDRPHIEGFDQDAWAAIHPDRAIEPSLAAFKALVDANIALFDSLSDADWERTATHSEFETYGVGVLLERGAEHGHEHAEQIRRCAR